MTAKSIMMQFLEAASIIGKVKSFLYAITRVV